MAAIDSYTASNEISDYWQDGNSVEIEDVSLEDSSTLDQIREQVEKPLKDRVEIIESNEDFTVSIIDGTIRVKELSKEVKARKVSFWRHRVIFYAALIPLSHLFVSVFLPVGASLTIAGAIKQVLLKILQCFILIVLAGQFDIASLQKSAWQANLAEDIAQLRQYAFAGGKFFSWGITHSEDIKHKNILIAAIARKYPGFSSHFCYACLGKNEFKRLSEGDPLYCTLIFGGYLRA